MHVKNVRQPVQWKRDNLESWRASHSKERREEDCAQLAELFNYAAEVPVLKDALDWAREHDVEFIMDETTSAGGYYHMGSGVVALSKRSFRDKSRIIGYLVHEIRHAWQDYYHMIPTAGKSFADYFKRLALVEADATAHQDLASLQFNTALDIARRRDWEQSDKVPARNAERLRLSEQRFEKLKRDPQRMWASFQGWYRSWKPQVYGETAVHGFGAALGVPGIAPKDHHFEYVPEAAEPLEYGIDADSIEEVRPLGKTFNGVNYFDAADRNWVTREFLSAARANVFYSTQEEALSPLVREVILRQKLLSLHKGQDVLVMPA
jgi:hypothetical protein